jgi:hypothetical protein
MADSYADIAAAAQSASLNQRETACAAQQGAPGDPYQWVVAHRYQLASQPGWGAAWASAVAADNPDPGADPAVITDAQILSAVQAILGAG